VDRLYHRGGSRATGDSIVHEDLRAINSDLLAEGDRVVALRGFEGTHDGPFMGVPPTGKHIVLDGITVFRVVSGRITERWSVLDMLGVMRQLGLLPEQAPGPSSGPA
jgi:hypothetical protein